MMFKEYYELAFATLNGETRKITFFSLRFLVLCTFVCIM